SVTHTGVAADASMLAEPTMSFGGGQLFNRKNWGSDIGGAPYVHYRLTTITTGTGGQTLVSYQPTECTRAFDPKPDANPYRCFPEYFKPQQAPAGWGWFHKYPVIQVVDRDLTGGSPDEVWSYSYGTGNASDTSLWRHDVNENV